MSLTISKERISEDIVDNLVEMYQSGMNVKQIREKTGLDKDTITRRLYERGIESSVQYRKLSDDKINLIEQMYVAGNKIIDISRITGIDRHVVSKYVNAYLVRTGNDRRHDPLRKYTLNENYFDVIDTPNKAYILGFLYADGCNMKDKGTISISLEEGDKAILEAMRNEIQSTKPLEFIKQSERLGKDSPYDYEDLWCLKLYSAHMCRSLEKVGVVPNKSLVLSFPKTLSPELYSHFIRGCFDGDGSITYRGCITLTSTYDFNNSVLNIISEMCPHAKINDASCHNGITSVLNIGRMKEVMTFCDWIYADADMYLERKHDIYLKYREYVLSRNKVA